MRMCVQADLEANLMGIGLTKEDAARFVLLGLEGVEGFKVRVRVKGRGKGRGRGRGWLLGLEKASMCRQGWD